MMNLGYGRGKGQKTPAGTEGLGGAYSLGKDGMYYPNLMIEETDQRSAGKWRRMYRDYLKEQHPSLYQRLILNGTLDRHLADANDRAPAMLESMITQRVRQEGVTEQFNSA